MPAWARARVFTVAPGTALAYREADWADAVVVLESGEIVVEASDGDHRWFEGGDVLCLAGMALVALHNHGDDEAVLVAVSRRHGPGTCGGGAGPGP
jgi:quercetin dioxygenase-like cupin family protein